MWHLTLYLWYLAPSVVWIPLLLGVALLARRFHLPVVAVAVLVGALFGVGWQWFWAGVSAMDLYGDADHFYNFVPARLGDLSHAEAREAFSSERSLPWESYDRIPWPLRTPQVSVIVSGLFWALVALLVGLWANRRPSRA